LLWVSIPFCLSESIERILLPFPQFKSNKNPYSPFPWGTRPFTLCIRTETAFQEQGPLCLFSERHYTDVILKVAHFLLGLYLLHIMQRVEISVAWVRERAIPTQRPPLVREVSANFCR
jgi:hypothetical protein